MTLSRTGMPVRKSDRCALLLSRLRADVLVWKRSEAIWRLTGGSSLGGALAVNDNGWIVGLTQKRRPQ